MRTTLGCAAESDAMRIRVSLLAAAWLAATPAHAAPSFEVLLSADFAGGHLSGDGSVAALSSASRSATGNSGFSWVRRLDEPSMSRPLISGVDNINTPVASDDGSIVYASSASPGADRRFDRIPSADFEYQEVPFAGGGRVLDTNADGSIFLISGARVTPTGTDILGFGTEISASGDIVAGTRDIGLDTGEAVRWENGVTTVLGDLPGGIERSFANGISADGTTIVGFGTSAAGREAALWRDGPIVPLGGLPGGGDSNALAVSGDGSVIVGSVEVAVGDSEPFYWTEAGGIRLLRTVLEDLGVVLPVGLDLGSATHVSDDGRRILGTGQGPDTDEFGTPEQVIWLATIPEPTTGVLLGAGLVALGIAGRRRPRR